MKSSTAFSTTGSQAILVVGEPKSGKSNLALAFPDPAIIDWDLNLASAVRRAGGKSFDYCQPGIKDDGSQRPATNNGHMQSRKPKPSARTRNTKPSSSTA